MTLQEIEDRVTSFIEFHLCFAWIYLTVGNPGEGAQGVLNEAASSINQLEYVYKHRRGGPRKAVQMKLHYYWTWHHLLTGAMQYGLADDNGGKYLLKLALKQAEMLVATEPANPKFNALLDRARRYQHN